MRILFDGQQLSQQMTGVGHYTDRVLRALLAHARSHHWLVLCHSGNADYVRPIVADPSRATTVVLQDPLPLDFRVQQEMLRKVVPEARADLCFSPSFLSAPRDVCPSVSVVHDVTYVLYPEFHPPGVAEYLHRCVTDTCRNVSRLIAVSENSKRDVTRIYHFPESRIAVVPHAADPSFFRPCQEPELAEVRQRLGLPGRYVLAVNMGNPKKNVRALLRALARVSIEARSGVKLVIAGEWSPGALDIPALVNEAGLDGEVVLTGYVSQDDLRCLYAGAQVFCFPSLHEGFGLPVLEAMASGVPVICSDAASLPEVAGDAAYLVAPADEAGWTAALEHLLTNQEARAELVEKGSRRAAQLSWERTAQLTQEVLEQAVPQPERIAARPGKREPLFEPVDLEGLFCGIAVDDVRPEPGFGGLRDDGPLGDLVRLHEELGCRFTLFVPTDWKGQWSVEEHPDWLAWLASQPCFEIACHGHLHACEPGSPDPGEFRGAEPQRLAAILRTALDTFERLGHRPVGVKAPGWQIEPSAYGLCDEHFAYVADHVCGVDVARMAGRSLLRFPYLFTIDELGPWPDSGLVVLQSHIGFEGSITNAWTPVVLDRVRSFLRTGARLGARFVTLGQLAAQLAESRVRLGATTVTVASASRDERLRCGTIQVLGREPGVLSGTFLQRTIHEEPDWHPSKLPGGTVFAAREPSTEAAKLSSVAAGTAVKRTRKAHHAPAREAPVAVVVHTCDKYQWVWEGWNFFFQQRWDFSLPWPVYLLTESASPTLSNVRVLRTGEGEWSDRLANGLRRIPVPYILYLQEDMWPVEPVDGQLLDELFRLFVEHRMDALRIQSTEIPGAESTDIFCRHKPLERLSQHSPFLVSHQPSFWRRGFLLEVLAPGENPWVHELAAGERLRRHPQGDIRLYKYDWQWTRHVVSGGEFNAQYEAIKGLLPARSGANDESGHEASQARGPAVIAGIKATENTPVSEIDPVANPSTGTMIDRYVLASHWCKGKRVLDAACGYGYGSAILLALGAREVVGVDTDDDALAYANAHYGSPRVSFLRLDLTAQPPASFGVFDTVVSIETMEHLPREAAAGYLRTLRGFVVPGGVVIVTTPRRAGGPWRYRGGAHRYEYSADEFSHLIGGAFRGLQVTLLGVEEFRAFGEARLYSRLTPVIDEATRIMVAAVEAVPAQAAR